MSVYETTIETLERLSEKCNKPVIILPDAVDRLIGICKTIDEIIPEIDADSYTVSVVPGTLAFEVSIEVPEMEIDDCKNHGLFKLIEMVDVLGFSSDGENISIDMTTRNLFCVAK